MLATGEPAELVGGRAVSTLYDSFATPGQVQRETFDGSSLVSGLYVYRLEYEDRQHARQIILIK